jgi:hypothetical protein
MTTIEERDERLRAALRANMRMAVMHVELVARMRESSNQLLGLLNHPHMAPQLAEHLTCIALRLADGAVDAAEEAARVTSTMSKGDA